MIFCLTDLIVFKRIVIAQISVVTNYKTNEVICTLLNKHLNILTHLLRLMKKVNVRLSFFKVKEFRNVTYLIVSITYFFTYCSHTLMNNLIEL